MNKPRLLDLFCGAGGAAMGYSRAGFDVVGVDINPQPHYPFEFVQANAIRVLDTKITMAPGGIAVGLEHFDVIHASPPCPGYTTMNNRHESLAPRLIREVRLKLSVLSLSYVIENVPGALREMRSPIELTGEMFGLGVHRPRLFESNCMLLAPARPSRQPEPASVHGKQDGRRLWTRANGSELRVADLAQGSTAMGIDWMGWDELKDAIPPAYTEFIGHQLLQFVGNGPAATSTDVAPWLTSD